MMTIRVDRSAGEADARDVWSVYSPVFDDQPDYESWREQVWDRHVVRSGFRLARAHSGGALVGFAYGYTGQQGQWWTDRAQEVLDPQLADEWLGGHFEVVSLGVIEASRRAGVGRELMRALTNEIDHDRLLLNTTADPDDPARRLYASQGWLVLGPGVGDATVIMGRRRPQPS